MFTTTNLNCPTCSNTLGLAEKVHFSRKVRSSNDQFEFIFDLIRHGIKLVSDVKYAVHN